VLRHGIHRGRDMKQLWAGLVDRPHIRRALGPAASLEDRHSAWPIPARIDRAPLARGRVLLAGDAAMASDVMTGEGIGQALLTGILAAEAVLGGPGPGTVTATYRRRARAALVADHRMSLLLIRAVRHRKGVRAGMRLAGATGWTRRNFARWLFEDYPRALVATPRRWHRGMFTGDGAYITERTGARSRT
jgi:menaquinone-9 beta-reductase